MFEFYTAVINKAGFNCTQPILHYTDSIVGRPATAKSDED